MERRRFLEGLAGTAAVATAGCTGGDELAERVAGKNGSRDGRAY